jgi:molybdopterin-containing oxidoreductase family iron-sulfur binding subunit
MSSIDPAPNPPGSDFDEIRSRLAATEGRAYWRSLEELADTPAFRDYVTREFPDQASEFTDPAGRRQFLKLMGASLALAGVSACTRQPEERIVPYVKQPEEVVPGNPLFFATAMPLGGFGMPLLAENHMGRPTKLEGNPEHPASLGATDIFGQASVLSLYDPDRSRTIVSRGDVRSWQTFTAALQSALQRHPGGEGVRLLTEPITSPSLIEQIEKLLETMPSAKWHQWDPVFGTVQGGAPTAQPLYHFDKADVVVSLDADFLGFGPGSLRYQKDFASRRRIRTPQDEQNRLYVAEPALTVTGTKSEHRLPSKAADIHALAAALASAAGAGGSASGAPVSGPAAAWVSAAAADLQAHRGRSVVVAGDRQPAAVHALARTMNEALGNVGTTVSYTAPVPASPADGAASISELAADMNAGRVGLLLIIGSNPVSTAPADVKFADGLAKMKDNGLIAHLGLYYDETAELCHWHIPEAHYLESWGDVRSFDGTVSLIQPLIAPIYTGRQAIELLAALNGTGGKPPVDLVKDYWSRAFAGQTKTTWTLQDGNGKAFASVDSFWRHALHDGFLAGTSLLAAAPAAAPATQQPRAGQAAAATAATTQSRAAQAAPAPAATPAPAPAPSGFEVVFRPDPTILDGRFANNGWLQELPKPISKVTWDSVAYVSVRTAERLRIPPTSAGDPNASGNGNKEIVEIKIQDRAIRLPVWILPGTADDVIGVHFGYGRQKAGRVGSRVGHDAFALRTSRAPWFEGGATVTKTGETYAIAATQNHFMMEGRNPVRVVTADEYRAEPKESIAKVGPEAPPKTLTLYEPWKYDGYKWGMSIDLNACTGCSVCVIACVAENNIPVVGKEQVMRTREMHWIRVDTYFQGSLDAPDTLNQPIPCMQCENAPCELVCPVAATQHSDEGLNDMVYNRCVGTRYCSNNCPYKVRRFNFLLYQDFVTPELRAARNPDVTIRSRGVMEKCTYCVQRIDHARIDAKVEDRRIADGDVKTACQQACPSDAIVFGDLNDPQSRVAQLVKQERNYGLLADLNTRPRTTYLAVVRNEGKA